MDGTTGGYRRRLGRGVGPGPSLYEAAQGLEQVGPAHEIIAQALVMSLNMALRSVFFYERHNRFARKDYRFRRYEDVIR